VPALSAFRGWAKIIGVPKAAGIGGSAYKRLFELWGSGELGPDYETYHWTSESVVPADRIAQAREILSPEEFNELFRAVWGTLGGGNVYYCFESSECLPPEGSLWDIHTAEDIHQIFNQPSRQGSAAPKLVIGCDFNVSSMSWICGALVDGRLSVFDELWLKNTNTGATIESLLHRLEKWGLTPEELGSNLVFAGDAAGRARHTNAATTDYLILKEHSRLRNATIVFPASNPAVADRIAVTNTSLRNAAGKRHMYIGRLCVRLAEDLASLSYKEGTRSVDAGGNMHATHFSDALGYAAWHTIGLAALRAEKQVAGPIKHATSGIASTGISGMLSGGGSNANAGRGGMPKAGIGSGGGIKSLVRPR
jgi:hypothetical protein